jgi:hypothetical protein
METDSPPPKIRRYKCHSLYPLLKADNGFYHNEIRIDGGFQRSRVMASGNEIRNQTPFLLMERAWVVINASASRGAKVLETETK